MTEHTREQAMNILSPEDWPSERWPNFTWEEFSCKHTKECIVDPEFMDEIQAIRNELCDYMTISSGYRHPDHPDEQNKREPGGHSRALAVDIKCYGMTAFLITQIALHRGNILGIGISQAGPRDKRFLHLDMKPSTYLGPRPWIWSY